MLVWTLFHQAGLDFAAWEIATLGVAIPSIVLYLRPQAPPPGRVVTAALIALPVWVLPAATYAAWLHLAVYILVFLAMRELAWRSSWIAALPLVGVAALEAALGLTQTYAHGTYLNRDHFAGLLEMALPFAAMYGVAALRTPLAASGAFACAALILAGVVHSLSRMGFLCALAGLAMAVAVTLRRKRWLLLAVPLFVFLPKDALIARFVEHAAEGRLRIWRETLPMVSDYWLTGCGLGRYESAFMKYKRSAPTVTDSYVHNDYLQYLVELGVPGFTLGLILVGAALWTRRDALGAACLGSMVAMLLHSAVDFNSYIPSNAMVYAWVAGVASGVGCRISGPESH